MRRQSWSAASRQSRGAPCSTIGSTALPHIVATLDAFEIFAHAAGRPRSVACQLRDVFPIAVVRRDKNHRVMGGASAKRPGSQVKYAWRRRALIFSRSRIALFACALAFWFAIMPDVEIPSHVRMFGRHSVKRRHLVIDGFVAAAGFQHQNPITRLGKIGGNRTAARPGPYDDIVVFLVHAVREHAARRGWWLR